MSTFLNKHVCQPMRRAARLRAAASPGDRILKVDHAGEHGAICIYTGQIRMARFTAPGLVAELQEFLSHERRHRALFLSELQRRGVRRCRSYWPIGVAGFALGIVTGLFGRAAIAATTVAVERVVLGHLKEQLVVLDGKDQAAVAAIADIVAEEQAHHDQSAVHALSGGFWAKILTPVVALSTEAVIWLGMRL
jgi:3-demethoxyubiquinol 3-hydroxylase